MVQKTLFLIGEDSATARLIHNFGEQDCEHKEDLYYNCTSELQILASRQKKYEILVKHASTPPPQN